ncbi:MAG: DUF389 domain-containing protein, partial [Chlamydiota bacterium]
LLKKLIEILFGDYQQFTEYPIDNDTMVETFARASLPAFGFYFLISTSSIIATLGLISNSSATIIGAMIIAPLMNPIITLGFGLTVNNTRLITRGTLMLVTGVPLVVGVAYFSSTILGIRAVGNEVISRSAPNYLDLGVALASGGAAAFAYTRKSIITALPGVAIAVALVPPLCVMGIGLHSGVLGKYLAATEGIDDDMWIGAMTLFLTNLWGIIFAAIIVFLTQGYGNWKTALSGLILTFIMVFSISFFLGGGLYKMYIRELFYRELLIMDVDERRFSEMHIRSINIRLRRGTYRVQVTLRANQAKLKNLEKVKTEITKIAEKLEKKLGEKVLIEVNVVPLYYIRSGPPDPRESIDPNQFK